MGGRYNVVLALFDISISIVHISTLLKNIDIDMVILKISTSLRQFWKISIAKSISKRQF